MITLSCARWYLKLEGEHLCLSSHMRIFAISDEKLASGGSFTIIVRILLCSRNGPTARDTAEYRGRSGAGLGGHLRRRSDLGLARHALPGQILYAACVNKTSVARMTTLALAA
jgi:hypothetical protein